MTEVWQVTKRNSEIIAEFDLVSNFFSSVSSFFLPLGLQQHQSSFD
jgi:hypothetical protein